MPDQPEKTDQLEETVGGADALASLAAAGDDTQDDPSGAGGGAPDVALPDDAGDALAVLEASGIHDLAGGTTDDDVASALDSGLPQDAGDALATLEASGLHDMGDAVAEADTAAALDAGPSGDAVGALAAISSPTGSSTPGAVRRRAGSGARDRAQANQFRKTMIPVLLALAVLLFLVGGLSTAMAIRVGTFEQMGPGTVSRARILAICAFPVAIVLVAGAVMFHSDVKKAEKSKKA